jgi:hypothetical protein
MIRLTVIKPTIIISPNSMADESYKIDNTPKNTASKPATPYTYQLTPTLSGSEPAEWATKLAIEYDVYLDDGSFARPTWITGYNLASKIVTIQSDD